MNKKELRSHIKEAKRSMTAEQIEALSSDLCRQFLETQAYRDARTIYAYLPYNQEVRTWAIAQQAWKDGKKVAVPKIYGDEMRFIYITDFSQLEKGCCGIPEPVADGPVADDTKALVLMPGLAFDREGHRIGYGGGYYDRFLEAEPEHPTIALCYAFQLMDQLDAEEHDIPVGRVLWA